MPYFRKIPVVRPHAPLQAGPSLLLATVRTVRQYLLTAGFLVAAASLAACNGDPAAIDAGPADVNPFESYLSESDPAFSYELIRTVEGEGYTTYVARMISQHWLTEEFVDEPEWWHWLTAVVPDDVQHSTALLWIGGGTNYSDVPEDAPEFLIQAALQSNTVAADLHNVPFQPVTFTGDTANHRYEDDLIAYGWRQFLEGGARDEDAEWLARLPMTTSARRAMDAISDGVRELNLTVDQFVVAGASKRGWTTWTTGIFDERVVAVVPVVIDLLNVIPSFEHHWQAYGEWSPAIREYEQERIMDWQYSQEFARLLEIVDPYSYLDSLDLPKFVINAASDEFFLPDSWKFYWDDLPGEKHIRYVPNTGHSISGTDAVESIISFHQRFVRNDPMPEFDWHVENSTIYVATDPDDPPANLRLWQATNPEARDFRLYVIDRSWTSTYLAMSEDGRYEVTVDAPDHGYTAYFVEAEFTGSGYAPLKLSSGVVVTPDTYPFEPFDPENPQGTPLAD